MTKALTAAGIQRLRPAKSGVREIPDGGCAGLYLLIHQTGRKSWALRYRRPGDRRPAKLTLGSVFDSADGKDVDVKPTIGGHLSLRSAHRLVAELKHDISLGRDPGLAHIAAKRAILSSDKFAGSALDFVKQHAMRKTRRWKGTARMLGLDPDDLLAIKGGLADRWRDKPVSEIDGDLIHHVIDEVREKGVPGLERRRAGPSESQARSMFAALSALFGWLIAKRRLRVNPCLGVAKPESSKARDRVLSDDEIVKFWHATEQVSHPFGPLLRLLLLTGARLNEIARARRSELSDDVLTIPAERSKNHRPHAIFLSPLAREQLRGLETDLLFTTNGRTPVSGWSKLKKRLDNETDIPPWRLHDIRRTVASGLAGIGIQLPVIERVLNHVSGSFGGIVGVYQRHEFKEEQKAALDRWANHIEGLVEGRPENVTPIRRGRRR
jgi:integrase